jgi:lipopolysaccharide transport system permease protein
MLFLLITGRLPGIALLGLVPLLVLQMMFAISIGMLFGVVNIFFRDVSHFSTILIQLWFWLTPIVYPINILPESVQAIVMMNPMSAIVMGYQNIFVYGQLPIWQTLLQPITATLVIALIASFFYIKHGDEMVDEL